MKKIIAILLAAVTLSTAVFAAKKQTIGVSMPTKDLQRWNQDGAYMKQTLEKAGFKVNLQYANNDVATQVSQIENMITAKVSVLVIAAIDSSALTNALDSAKKKKIPVIAYDRLIMNSDAVTYYATFDNYKVGSIQGEYLVDKLNLKNRTKADPAYMEFFTGDPGDNNIHYFFGGAMDILRPYIESGVIVCRSGQTAEAQCATLNWSGEKAQERMENLITSNGYGPKGKKLDAVYSSNDSCAMGISNALVAAGYTKDNIPVITGQDCDIASMKLMLSGLQAMSICKDTRKLAVKVGEMIDDILNGRAPDVNDTTTYNNNVKVVPSYLLAPFYCDISNYQDLLIKSGYYKESELK